MKCNHSHFHAANNRIDPTQTTALRKRFEADFVRRFRSLIRDIKQAIVEDDGFGLNGLKTNRQFDFATNQEKVAGFMSWLSNRQDFHLFENTLAEPRFVASQHVWMNTYIQTAYRRAMAKSTSEIRQAGGSVDKNYLEVAFLRPVHADRAGKAFTRAYSDLAGITEKMDSQISEVISEGLLNGFNPTKIARKITDRVEKIGITRARLLARTEVISAHAEAKLNVYEEAGIQGIGLMSEWLTAGDGKVCPECQAAAAAGPYTVQGSRGLIPLHPNCRCTWIPLIETGREVTLS